MPLLCYPVCPFTKPPLLHYRGLVCTDDCASLTSDCVPLAAGNNFKIQSCDLLVFSFRPPAIRCNVYSTLNLNISKHFHTLHNKLHISQGKLNNACLTLHPHTTHFTLHITHYTTHISHSTLHTIHTTDLYMYSSCCGLCQGPSMGSEDRPLQNGLIHN